jgi:hypothetical protein
MFRYPKLLLMLCSMSFSLGISGVLVSQVVSSRHGIEFKINNGSSASAWMFLQVLGHLQGAKPEYLRNQGNMIMSKA